MTEKPKDSSLGPVLGGVGAGLIKGALVRSADRVINYALPAVSDGLLVSAINDLKERPKRAGCKTGFAIVLFLAAQRRRELQAKI